MLWIPLPSKHGEHHLPNAAPSRRADRGSCTVDGGPCASPRAIADFGRSAHDTRVRDPRAPAHVHGWSHAGACRARAEDLHAAFEAADAVLPPWGGELAIELVEKIDWDALAEARPWFVGWSDISTLLLPLTTRTGLATLHGANLMDEPYELPSEFERWTDVAALPPGSTFEQRSAPRRRSRPWGAWADEPLDREHAYEAATKWRSLDGTDTSRCAAV